MAILLIWGRKSCLGRRSFAIDRAAPIPRIRSATTSVTYGPWCSAWVSHPRLPTSADRALSRRFATAENGQIAARMANEFDKSAFLRKTYAPVDLQAVRAADEARKRGRKQSEQSWNNSNFRRIGELEWSGGLTAKYLK